MSLNNASTSPPRRWKSAFTLIEMLVVIAILALLSSIVIPSISGALKRAKTTKGLSNLRQLGTAFSMYATERSGKLPYQQSSSTNTWHLDVAPYLEGFTGRHFYDLAQVGSRPPGVFACPVSDSLIRPGNYSDYGMNLLVNDHGDTQNDPQRSMDMLPSADMILLADSLNCRRNLSIYSENGGLDPRHRKGGVNVLYIDGHVVTETLATLWEEIEGDKRYQSPWGWPGWRN